MDSLLPPKLESQGSVVLSPGCPFESPRRLFRSTSVLPPELLV